jgi:lysophospholipase L1-like esterase
LFELREYRQVRKPIFFSSEEIIVLPSAMIKFPVGFLLTLLIAISPVRSDLLVKDGQKVVFMGDSITNLGWDLPGGYVHLVVDGLKTLGVNIVPVPAGISGQTSREMVARTETDVVGNKPDWLTLSCGVNDVWHGAGGVELDQYQKNITSIVDQAQAAGIKVMLLTSTPIGEDNPNPNNQKLVAYNDFLKQLAKTRNLPIADENAAFQTAITAAATPGINALTMDGVHPNPTGNVLMAKAILAAFGATPDQVNQAEQAWQDIPDLATYRLNLLFRVSYGVTLRQFQAIKAAAAQQKISVDEFNNRLFLQAMFETAKAHEGDATTPSSDVVEVQMQNLLKAKIAALVKP